MRVVDFHDGDLKMMLEAASSMGRGGDTELVHINKAEEKILKEAGGAGTINPKTGLREFYQPEGGAGKASDTASGSKKSGIDKDKPGKSTSGGEGGSKSSGDRAIDNPLVRGAGGFMSPTGKLGQRADVKAMTGGAGLSDSDANEISRDWADRVSGLAGVDIDPLGIGLGLLGAINPIAGLLGLGYQGLKSTGVIDAPSINIGGSQMSVADLIGAKTGIGTASGAGSNRGGRDSDPGKNRDRFSDSKRNRSGSTTTTPPQPATPNNPPAPVKSPADVLLERYKLPGINAPFDLAPYTINRTQHEQLVANALEGVE